MTLRSRLFVAFVTVVGVPLLIGLILLSTALPRAFGREQQRAVSSSARLAAGVLSAECDRARAVAEAGGRAVLAVPADAADQQRAALQSLVQRGLADGLAVTDTTGRTVTAGTPPPDGDCATGQVQPGALVAVAQLQQAGAARPGRAVASVRQLGDVLRDLQTSPSNAVALVQGSHVVASLGPLDSHVLRAAIGTPSGVVSVSGHVAAVAPVRPGSALLVVIMAPATHGLGVVRTGLGVVAGVVLLAAAFALLAARATTRPLEQLGEAAARVAAGDLGTTIDVRSRDEVGRLGASFNTMTEELRGYVGELEASRDELRSGLARLGETLTSTHDLERILAVVLDTAIATTAAQAGVVLLVDAGRGTLDLAVGRGLEDRVTGHLRLRLGEGVLGRVAADGQPLHGAVADLSPSRAEPAATSLIAVPMRTRRSVIGVLALYDPRSGADDDVATLRTLADQAAVAVDNVLLHRDATRMAVTDGLTGLANYRSFTDTIASEIDRASRYGRPLGLVLLDIDHFKLVNDTHGHQRGDAVLIELAARVRAQVRDVDTVARYGGEELVVVLPETDLPGSELAAERIRKSVRDMPFGAGDSAVRVTVSLGIAVHPDDGGTATALLRRADEALYEAKRAGRDAWRSRSGRRPAGEHAGEPLGEPARETAPAGDGPG